MAGGDGAEAATPKFVKLIDAIKEKEDKGEVWWAFEFFPPKTDAGVSNLYARMEKMKRLSPLYTDVTWGAGGSTSDLTLELCVESKKRFELETNMHLTCTNMPAEKVDTALAGCKEAGVGNIVALRGDPPAGEEAWEAVEGGFSCALDLVKYIRKEHGDHFGISVAGYPEGHPNTIKKVEDPGSLTESERLRAVDMEDGIYVCSDADYAKEMAYLKEKVDAGAQFIITQMFFDVDTFLAFVKDCRAIGIECPIVPGIMVIQNYGGFGRMTKFCKSRVPAWLRAKLDAVKDDDAAVKAAGIEIGIDMCRKLLDNGVLGLHFYTLNLAKVTNAILEGLDLVEKGTYADAE